MTEVSTEVLITRDLEAMASINSLESALQVLADSGIVVADTADFGDGFELLKDKASLVNVPFLIVGYKFAAGDFGEQFVVIHLVTETGKKYIITDGGSGIRQQCELYASKGARALKVKRGLIRSDFHYVEGAKKGDPVIIVKPGDDRFAEATQGTTYYLS